MTGNPMILGASLGFDLYHIHKIVDFKGTRVAASYCIDAPDILPAGCMTSITLEDGFVCPEELLIVRDGTHGY